MRRLLVSALLGLAAIIGIAVALRPGDAQQIPPGLFDEARGPTLTRFASAAAFERYVRRLGRGQGALSLDASPPAPMDVENAAAEPMGYADAGQTGNPEITNNQTIGVDEGGIVKQIGRFLVVLQDGRLFSADLGAGAGAPLRLADRIDVYRSQANAASWYDEMLVHGDRILVTAYNYREGASEITVIRMDRQGRLTREGRFLLSSNDYYSTENYATRIVGDNLVFYAPQALVAAGPDGRFAWPRIRRAERDGEADAGEALIGPTDVYAPPGRAHHNVLHTLSVCPLRGAMDCRTTAFIGPPMRELYVSPTDAFLWIGAPDGLPWSIDYANRRRQDCPPEQVWESGETQAALLYRLPLDGGPVGAVALDGVPADQFAFDSREGRFRALLAREPAGCAGGAARRLTLLDIPLAAFDDTIRHVSDRGYADLPPIMEGVLENRFIGRWLVYGGRTGSDSPLDGGDARAGSTLVAVPLARPSEAMRLALPHNALRIERAGSDAVVTGYRDASGLSLSYVSLAGARPRIAATALLPRRFESEGRSHAFNAWIRGDGSGLIGLPTTFRASRSNRDWSDSASSELSFIAVAPDKTLSHAGQLAPRRRAGPSRRGGYLCEVSCVDWYGNSRPIFTGGRIFALMGTDLVEGRMGSGRIGEVGRLDLTGRPRG
jgi:Beta propeller domain